MVRWFRRLALLLLGLILVFAILAWWLLRASLPQLDGEVVLGDLSAPVTIQRDALGVVTIDAANETDAMRALGYVHAQERYFEMDLMRRTAAGELSELFGPIALETDKKHRMHRMRARVMQNLDRIAGDKLPQLQAYTDGVHAGLFALDVRPWPYLLLRAKPEPWQMVDSALVGFAMYFDLQDAQNTRELALIKIRPHLPPALFALLARDGTSWDAPLFGEPRGDAQLPEAALVDLRDLPAPPRDGVQALASKGTPGSNNFAVSGELTPDGRAIVADDMHLGLRAPNIWFRARLRYRDPAAPGGRTDVQGFTLPGLPAVIVGSNGHVAWGFTNGYVDNSDAGVPCVKAHDSCLEAQSENARIDIERILVRGSPPLDLHIPEFQPLQWPGTRSAIPITQTPPGDIWVANLWSAYSPDAISLDLARTATMRSVDNVLGSPLIGLPAQNFVIADRTGRIAWMISGNVPTHVPGCDRYALALLGQPRPVLNEVRDIKAKGASLPSIGAGQQSTHPDPTEAVREGEGCEGRPMTAAETPMLADPDSHRLWTANNRTLDGEALQKVGDGGYALGARAKQIRDDLFAKDKFTERDLLAIQLDDRAVFLERWWKLLVHQAAVSRTPALAALSDAASDWTGRASTGSVAYRVVRAWRLAVHARIADGLTAPAQAALGKDFVMPDLPQLEGVVWPLLRQRPQHLLSRRYDSWDALLEDAAKEVHDELASQGPLSARTWGERNTADICHPLANAIPLVGRRMLCMPADQLPGDTAMPRVQGPRFGASERMVVSPGHEEDGIIHMPGGQSGHFLSPFWGAGHDDWVHGRPTPFLPGKAEHTLRLTP
ncbi:penicillin acylase family protein [Lysobacter sp. M15]|uniref:penicillin acylase family protein n=1 Tax=Lysobacter sp. M15 TaxID=2916837 RepID=UPI001F584100|nr:penicillin acylase family protein [Lysobacter sp. M15]